MKTSIISLFFPLLLQTFTMTAVFSEDIVLPALPYGYACLEPVISEKIMRLHHTKHHQAYINNYNQASKSLEQAMQSGDLSQIELLQETIKFNLGGHLNHAFFWKVLTPMNSSKGLSENSELLQQINSQFGSLESFQALFNKKALGVQGSGWCWLGYQRNNKALEIKTTLNQDPLILFEMEPVFGVDVWEHAYYLDYENRRGDYLSQIWSIVNWQQVEENYNAAVRKA